MGVLRIFGLRGRDSALELLIQAWAERSYDAYYRISLQPSGLWFARWKQGPLFLSVQELAARTDERVAAFLVAIKWVQTVWTREIMVGLAEANFTNVPPDILEELLHVAMAFKGSKIVEDGFNCCRDRSRHDKQGNISRVARTHRIQSSRLLEDTDRARLPVDTMAKMVAPTFLPAAAFAATSHANFSLPDEFLQEYMDGKNALVPRKDSTVPVVCC